MKSIETRINNINSRLKETTNEPNIALITKNTKEDNGFKYHIGLSWDTGRMGQWKQKDIYTNDYKTFLKDNDFKHTSVISILVDDDDGKDLIDEELMT